MEAPPTHSWQSPVQMKIPFFPPVVSTWSPHRSVYFKPLACLFHTIWARLVGNLPMWSQLLNYFTILQWWVSGFLYRVVCSAQLLVNVHVLRRPSPSICLTSHMFYIIEVWEKGRGDPARLESLACMFPGRTVTHIVRENLKYLSFAKKRWQLKAPHLINSAYSSLGIGI